jgi:hypothetical protein
VPVDAGHTVGFRRRPGDRGAEGLPKGEVAFGMVGVMVGGQDQVELPALFLHARH